MSIVHIILLTEFLFLSLIRIYNNLHACSFLFELIHRKFIDGKDPQAIYLK